MLCFPLFFSLLLVIMFSSIHTFGNSCQFWQMNSVILEQSSNYPFFSSE